MDLKSCALPGCPKFVGVVPYLVAGRKEEYCSRACCDVAFDMKLSELKKRKRQMEKHADDFGDANVVRHFCDHESCGKPITVAWTGRYGKYCCNTCLQLNENSEKEITNMADTNETTTTSPITAGAPVAKKAPKGKAAKKAAPVVKKAAKGKAAKAAPVATAKKAPKEPKDGKTSEKDAQVLHINDSVANDMRGKRADVMKLLKDGMTLGAFKAAVCKKFDSTSGLPLAVLKAAVAKGMVTTA